MSDPLFDCIDCGVNTVDIEEYYGVHDDVWLLAHPDDFGMMCIGCLEARLGRKLTYADFTSWPINDVFPQSDRLKNRLGRYGEQKEVDVP